MTGFFQIIADAMVVVINWVLWLGPIGVFALALVFGAKAGTSAIGVLLHYVAIVSAVGVVVWLLAFPLGEQPRSEEHTSELQSLMRISYAVLCLQKKKFHVMRVMRPYPICNF